MNRTEIENATLSELMKRNKELATRMNGRMKVFSDKNESSYALNLMKDFLDKQGLKKYTTSVKKLGGLDELRDQVIHLEKINKMATATYRGAKKHYERSIASLGLKKMLKADSKVQSDFKTFLQSDAWREIKEYDSERIYEIVDAFLGGNTIESLEIKWNEYESGEIDLDQVVDEWVEADEDFEE